MGIKIDLSDNLIVEHHINLSFSFRFYQCANPSIGIRLEKLLFTKNLSKSLTMSLTKSSLSNSFCFALILNKSSLLSICIQYRDRSECTVFPFLLSNRIHQSSSCLKGTRIVFDDLERNNINHSCAIILI